jgi:hypothetical protein
MTLSRSSFLVSKKNVFVSLRASCKSGSALTSGAIDWTSTGILSFMSDSENNCNLSERHQKMDQLVDSLEEAILLARELELDMVSHITKMALIEAFNQKAILVRCQ